MLKDHELIAYLENTLPPAERARVEAELGRDPQRRRQVIHQSQVDAALRAMLGRSAANERVKQSVLAVIRGESEEAIKRQVLVDTAFLSRGGGREAEVSASSPFRRVTSAATNLLQLFRRPTWAFSFATACFCIGLGVWLALRFVQPRPAIPTLAFEIPTRVQFPAGTGYSPTNPTADLVQSFRNAGSLVPKGGDGLRVSDGGSGTVTFADGTVLHLEPGTEVRFQPVANPRRHGGKQLKLISGSLSADVARQPEGLSLLIETPHALVTVVGTEFDLSVVAQQTELEVTRGLVKLVEVGAAQSVSVAAGEFAVAAPNAAVRYGRLARNPYLWPFSSTSIWNRPLGSRVKSLSLPVLSFIADGPLTNVLRPRRPLLGSANDPLRRIWVKGEVRADIRLPETNLPRAGMRDAIVLLQHGRRYALELLDARVRPDGDLEAADIERVPLNGPGTTPNSIPAIPFGLSIFGGLLRAGELENGIPHALAARVNRGRLAGRDFARPFTVWPATGNAATGADTETLCVGALLAIPPGVELGAIVGDSGPAYELARAMQDYGVYVTGAGDAPFMLLADSARIPEADAWLTKLVPLLQVVANNFPETPAGGGTPRRDSAPPLPRETP